MKVLVGMSGGVDSTVVAALLKEAGHEVVGAHLQFWSDGFVPPKATKTPQNKCCSIEALMATRRAAGRLGVPLYVLNVRDEFKERVVDHFIAGSAAGDTPNPCVRCNKQIKFGLFLEKMRELDCDAVATGHYGRIERNEKSGEFELLRAKDPTKDQSYFLYHLNQYKLGKILLPLGGLLKSEVRQLAEDRGLIESAQRSESQGVCFFPEAGPQDFLQRNLPADKLQPGPIVTVDGRVVGRHLGLPLYTIGQRRGVAIGGLAEPHFVVGVNREKNALIIGPERFTQIIRLAANDLFWVSRTKPAGTIRAQVAVRYRAQPVPASIRIENDTAAIELDEPVKAAMPGQAVTFLDGEKILGGGTII